MSDIYNPFLIEVGSVVVQATQPAPSLMDVYTKDHAMRKVGWFDIYVDDMERAQRFYETVLETKLSSMDDPNDASIQMRAFEDDYASHGAGGALVKMDYAKPGPGGSMVYFSCDDCAVEQGRAENAGGTVARPKFSIGDHGFVSLIMDTEGNMVGLHSQS